MSINRKGKAVPVFNGAPRYEGVSLN